MMYWGNHMGAGGWIFSILATLIFVALIVALIVWLVSPNSRSDHSPDVSAESPREILDRRLASGEITTEQYEQLRDALDHAPSSSPDARPRAPAGTPG